MSEDDRALMERLAALEAEVKADAEAQQKRRAAAMEKVREQRAAQQAERDALRDRQAALVTKRSGSEAGPLGSVTRGRKPEDSDDATPRSRSGDLGTAIELAGKASDMKHELAKPTKAGEKSWVKSALLSGLFGPLGWLYAGSFREAAPASAAWLAFAAIAAKLPTLLLFPVLMVVMPLSGIAGLLYAVQYNRNGRKRQRLFGDKKKKKELPPGK
ncbi:MAG: hypothetical protein ACKV2T_08830 [Kofleriaceae bacterium]